MAKTKAKAPKEFEKITEIIKREIHPAKIILFGSRARGDYVKESDFDLLVIVSEEANNRLLAQQIYLLLTKNRIKIPVDVIVESQKKFDAKKENPFIIYHQSHFWFIKIGHFPKHIRCMCFFLLLRRQG